MVKKIITFLILLQNASLVAQDSCNELALNLDISISKSNCLIVRIINPNNVLISICKLNYINSIFYNVRIVDLKNEESLEIRCGTISFDLNNLMNKKSTCKTIEPNDNYSFKFKLLGPCKSSLKSWNNKVKLPRGHYKIYLSYYFSNYYLDKTEEVKENVLIGDFAVEKEIIVN